MSHTLSADSLEGATASSAVAKYRTLARAITAQDAPACREIYNVFTNSLHKTLSDEEVLAMGIRWLSSGQKDDQPPRNIEVAKFLADIGFNFSMTVRLQKDEVVGAPIPFKLIDDKADHGVLLELIDAGLVKSTVSDGAGNSLIAAALAAAAFGLADDLVARGVDLNETNLAGQTALHDMAANANFRAVDWLLRHGADANAEDMEGSRPSQMVPETVGPTYDVDSMFDTLEDAAEAQKNGHPYTPRPEFVAMMRQEAKDAGEDVGDDQTLGERTDELSGIAKSLGI